MLINPGYSRKTPESEVYDGFTVLGFNTGGEPGL